MLRYAEVGYPVLGFDIDPAKVEQLNAGKSYIEHIPAAAIARARARGFSATTDHDRFDYDLIQRHAPLIVDTRGRYPEPAAHIVKA